MRISPTAESSRSRWGQRQIKTGAAHRMRRHPRCPAHVRKRGAWHSCTRAPIRQPMYEQLKELLREVIQSGEFAEREREVVEHYQVSRPTANKVLSGMAAKCLVEFRKGVGALVRRRNLDSFAAKIFHAHAKDARINRQKLNEAGILAHPLKYHYRSEER